MVRVAKKEAFSRSTVHRSFLNLCHQQKYNKEKLSYRNPVLSKYMHVFMYKYIAIKNDLGEL